MDSVVTKTSVGTSYLSCPRRMDERQKGGSSRRRMSSRRERFKSRDLGDLGLFGVYEIVYSSVRKTLLYEMMRRRLHLENRPCSVEQVLGYCGPLRLCRFRSDLWRRFWMNIYRTPELDENSGHSSSKPMTFFLKRIVEHAAGDAAFESNQELVLDTYCGALCSDRSYRGVRARSAKIQSCLSTLS